MGREPEGSFIQAIYAPVQFCAGVFLSEYGKRRRPEGIQATKIFKRGGTEMNELNAVMYDYFTKSAGMSVGDAWQVLNTITGRDETDGENREVRYENDGFIFR